MTDKPKPMSPKTLEQLKKLVHPSGWQMQEACAEIERCWKANEELALGPGRGEMKRLREENARLEETTGCDCNCPSCREKK